MADVNNPINNDFQLGGHVGGADEDVARFRSIGQRQNTTAAPTVSWEGGDKFGTFANQSRAGGVDALTLMRQRANGIHTASDATMNRATAAAIANTRSIQAAARGRGAIAGAPQTSNALASSLNTSNENNKAIVNAKDTALAQDQLSQGYGATREQDMSQQGIGDTRANFITDLEMQQRAANDANNFGYERRAFGVNASRLAAEQALEDAQYGDWAQRSGQHENMAGMEQGQGMLYGSAGANGLGAGAGYLYGQGSSGPGGGGVGNGYGSNGDPLWRDPNVMNSDARVKKWIEDVGAANRAARKVEEDPSTSAPVEEAKAEIEKTPLTDMNDKVRPVAYNYAHPAYDVPGQAPGQRHVGVLAQDLAKSEAGRSLLGPNGPGGELTVSVPKATMANLATGADLHQRLTKLEAKDYAADVNRLRSKGKLAPQAITDPKGSMDQMSPEEAAKLAADTPDSGVVEQPGRSNLEDKAMVPTTVADPLETLDREGDGDLAPGAPQAAPNGNLLGTAIPGNGGGAAGYEDPRPLADQAQKQGPGILSRAVATQKAGLAAGGKLLKEHGADAAKYALAPPTALLDASTAIANKISPPKLQLTNEPAPGASSYEMGNLAGVNTGMMGDVPPPKASDAAAEPEMGPPAAPPPSSYTIPAHYVDTIGPKNWALLNDAERANLEAAEKIGDRKYEHYLVEQAMAGLHGQQADARGTDAETQRKAQFEELTKKGAEISADAKALANYHEDPSRFYNSRSTGQKIAGLLGVMLGGFAQGLRGGPNTALDMINKAQDDDIAAQRHGYMANKDSLAAKNSAYGLAMEKYHNDFLAQNVVRTAQLDRQESDAQVMAAQSKGVETQNHLDAIMADTAQRRADLAIAYNKWVQKQTVQTGGNGLTQGQQFQLQLKKIEHGYDMEKLGVTQGNKTKEEEAKSAEKARESTFRVDGKEYVANSKDVALKATESAKASTEAIKAIDEINRINSHPMYANSPKGREELNQHYSNLTLFYPRSQTDSQRLNEKEIKLAETSISKHHHDAIKGDFTGATKTGLNVVRQQLVDRKKELVDSAKPAGGAPVLDEKTPSTFKEGK